MMTHKGYTATVSFDDQAGVFHGEVAGTRAVVTFRAESAEGLKQEFEASADDYLDWCEERGKEPDKPTSRRTSTPGVTRLFRVLPPSTPLFVSDAQEYPGLHRPTTS